MKVIDSILFALLLLSVGIGNEGPMKMTEAKVCDKLFTNLCDSHTCLEDCVGEFGPGAYGSCNQSDQCICQFRC
ncbi:hypothetical protein Fmac_018396 [Flemingia macrophylla]|uniref:Defensin-like protein n=1 Tax=Flemingia macrophylla TaxID=520843 RepID=A0ABD1M6S8_9FABA